MYASSTYVRILLSWLLVTNWAMKIICDKISRDEYNPYNPLFLFIVLSGLLDKIIIFRGRTILILCEYSLELQ